MTAVIACGDENSHGLYDPVGEAGPVDNGADARRGGDAPFDASSGDTSGEVGKDASAEGPADERIEAGEASLDTSDARLDAGLDDKRVDATSEASADGSMNAACPKEGCVQCSGFAAPTVYPVGSPTAMIATDVNGDGVLDLAFTSLFPDEVGFLLGNGDGTFTTAPTISLGYQPWSLALGDLDGDRATDLVVGGNGLIEVMLGKGDATFGPAMDWPAAVGPTTVRVADLDGNGSLDIITAERLADKVMVMLGHGDGSFGEPIVVSAAVAGDIATADVNGDGKLDMLTTSSDLGVLLGNGDGTFQQRTSVAIPSSNAGALAIHDLNADGKLDVIVSGNDDGVVGHVSVLLGNGNGTFGTPRTFEVGLNPSWLSIAEMNGDGKPDLVVGNGDSEDVSILFGSGDGAFGKARNYIVGFSLQTVATGDFDRDGTTDVATGFLSGVDILTGRGDGTMRAATSVRLGDGAYSIRAADLNRDGIADLAVGVGSPGAVDVLLGGRDWPSDPISSPVGSFQGSIALADPDGDGRLDALVLQQLPDIMAVLPAEGGGRFDQPQSVPGSSSYAGPDLIRVGDVNNDGYEDALTINVDSISVFLGRGGGVDAGTGRDGGRVVPFEPPRNLAIGMSAYAATLGDLNKDGALDLVLIPNDHTNVVKVMMGGGDGSFGPATSFATGSMPGALAVGDVDGDGNLDVVVVNDRSNDMSVLLGQGDGSLSLAKTSDLGRTFGPTAVALADLNGDQRLDAVVSNGELSTLTVSYGNGDGSFQRPWPLSVADHTGSLAIADVNGDGKLDLAVTTRNTIAGGRVHVFFGASCTR